MNRGIRHRLLSQGVWPSLLNAANHIKWKCYLFSIALLHFFFSSDKQWLQSSSSFSPVTVDTFSDATVLLISTGTDQQATVVIKRKRIIFVRHAESEWNFIFNRGLNLRAFMNLLRAVVYEWLVLLTGDSLFLDSPLSRRGRFQAKNLQNHVCEMSVEGRSDGDKAVAATLSPVEALYHSPLQMIEESSLLSYLCFSLPGSIVVTSNLRRTIDTARIASASRLEVPGEKIHVLSCLQEIGRNVDTLAISKPHAVQPHEVLVDPPRGEKCHDELFDVVESHGNKAVLGSGRDRLLTFAHWVFKQPKDVVIVYGHSLWLRAFFREFFPCNVFHEAKSTKIRNCGVVTFLLEEHSRGGGHTAQYNIPPESFQRLV
ncbi:unnamed protein product [Peronospora farinosa]|uniref:Uncharacterized protein n=1 Tax=Peronospora farinosa TaxID=134698 RepID=A0AAV0SNL1_9STRA|nr:unnamed protein product [Peronospora farinosa]CAI5704482.1 unnamed protein product [Peronospora farinosa]